MIFDKEHLSNLEDILHFVKQAGATEAIVAGGAVRDMLLGKPIKDIDVFYTGELSNVEKYFTVETIEDDESYEGTEFSVTHRHVTYEYCDYPIQLIKVDNLRKVVDIFGCNLSKTAFEEVGVVLFPDFMEGVRTHKVVIDNNCKTEEFAQRIKEKYSDWEVVDERIAGGIIPIEF